MKKLFLLFYLLLTIYYSKSQNLVPNGDFEFYTSCPTAPGQMNLAFPWHDPTGATSDYYNGCAPLSSFVNVPGTPFGQFQYAHSGVGYAAIIVMQSNGTNYREYIQVALIDTLEIGRCYSVSFYANLSDLLKKGTNNIGAYLSQMAITTAPPNVLNYNPQILLPGNPPIIDTLNWVKISGLYQAVGGEKYITIGNFKDDSNTSTQTIDTASQFDMSAYYIDDVSVYELKARAGKDTNICKGSSTQIGSTSDTGIIYSWQPTNGLSAANIANPLASPSQTTTYYLTQTSPCGITKDTVTITICDTIKNTSAGKDTTICNGNSVTLGSGNYACAIYSWQPPTGLNNANIGNPIASPTQTTTYYLTQTSPCGITKDSVSITVCDTTHPSSLTIPNVFTPNNDGINDVFKIISKNILTLDCKIYNRWGILVNELTKFNEVWDGRTTSGLQCTTGVYYYVITSTGEDGKDYNEKGVMELMR